MARDFDLFPTNDPIINRGSIYLSDIWSLFLNTFIQTLTEYLTQNGIYMPPLTTAERDALQNVRNGLVIYNTTIDQFQGRRAGAWVNL